MGSQQAVKLRLYSTSKLPAPISPEKLACSPTLDLLAAVDDDNGLFIRRANAEQVAKPVQRPNQQVVALRWKPDGQYVAAAWSDGVVRLMGIESTKTLHQISPRDDNQPEIEYLAWSRNWTGRDHLRPGNNPSRSTGHWGGLVPGALEGLSLGEQKELLDFPRDITFLEVETALPKISPLPVSGGTGDDTFVFSSRTSLEFVFKDFRPEDADKVDVMIVGMVDGSMRLTIYDTFDVGMLRYCLPVPSKPGTRQQQQQQQPLRLTCHASNPALSTHSLLLRAHDGSLDTLYLVPMDLHFVYSSPINLSLLASKVTILQKLLRYIHQTQAHMASEWASTRELPARFLRNVSEDLREAPQGPMDIIQALYHTVLTGHAYPIVKEWLVDSVAERGHKRWDKAVTSGLENLRALIHENMLPALERCAIILGRLLGLARFHDSGRSEIGFSAAKITRLLEIVSCLTLVSHKILVHVMDELELFTMFSSWLRFQIDRLASSASSGAEELSEREATMDNGKVLEYVSDYLMQSPASLYFGPADSENFRMDQARLDDGLPLLDTLDQQIHKAEDDQAHMKALPRVDFLVSYLKTKSQAIFDDIAEAERRSVRFGPPTMLVIGGPISKHEVHMCSLPKTNGVDGLTYTALSPSDRQNELYIFRTKMTIINGISSGLATGVCALNLTGGNLLDFKFLDDALIVLWQPDEEGASPFLFRVSLQAVESRCVPYDEGIAPTAREASVHDLMGGSPRMDMSSAADDDDRPGFHPIWMEVKKPSSTRGRVPARLCLLGSDRMTYKAFALPDEFQFD